MFYRLFAPSLIYHIFSLLTMLFLAFRQSFVRHFFSFLNKSYITSTHFLFVRHYFIPLSRKILTSLCPSPLFLRGAIFPILYRTIHAYFFSAGTDIARSVFSLFFCLLWYKNRIFLQHISKYQLHLHFFDTFFCFFFSFLLFCFYLLFHHLLFFCQAGFFFPCRFSEKNKALFSQITQEILVIYFFHRNICAETSPSPTIHPKFLPKLPISPQKSFHFLYTAP